MSWRRRSSICASIVSSIESSAGTTGPSPADFGTADRRRVVEIEFAALELRDFRELLAERVEADELRLHAADAGGQRRDLVVGVLFDACELLASARRDLRSSARA